MRSCFYNSVFSSLYLQYHFSIGLLFWSFSFFTPMPLPFLPDSCPISSGELLPFPYPKTHKKSFLIVFGFFTTMPGIGIYDIEQVGVLCKTLFTSVLVSTEGTTVFSKDPIFIYIFRILSSKHQNPFVLLAMVIPTNYREFLHRCNPKSALFIYAMVCINWNHDG